MGFSTPFELTDVSCLALAALVSHLTFLPDPNSIDASPYLSLESSFTEYIPSTSQYHKFTSDLLVVDGNDLTPNITLKHLLQHTSGLPDLWSDPPLGFDSPDTGEINAFVNDWMSPGGEDKVWTHGEVLEYLPNLHLDEPVPPSDDAFHYSSANFALLGIVVEERLNQTLGAALRAHVFDNLGMDETYMKYEEDARSATPESRRYEASQDVSGMTRYTAAWPGNLVSTVDDMSIMMRTLFNETGDSAFQGYGWLMTNTDDFVDVDGAGTFIGLGILYIEDTGYGPLIGMNAGGGNAFAYYFPAQKAAVTGTLNQVRNDAVALVYKGLCQVSECRLDLGVKGFDQCEVFPPHYDSHVVGAVAAGTVFALAMMCLTYNKAVAWKRGGYAMPVFRSSLEGRLEDYAARQSHAVQMRSLGPPVPAKRGARENGNQQAARNPMRRWEHP